MKKRNPHPMQQIIFDDHNVARFRENAIVRYLLDSGPFDMNTIAFMPGISAEDRSQFAQLIGYSVSGFGDLNYCDRDQLRDADAEVARMLAAEKQSNDKAD
jgi:hypothetical protein